MWYTFTAVSTSHTVTVVGGATFDAVFNVIAGNCSGPSVGCVDDDYTVGGPETLNLSGLTPGTNYFIRVHSYTRSPQYRGEFTICVTHTACPPTLTVTESITSGTVVKEAVKVTATNQVAGGIVTYKAAQSVTLQSDFRAATGAGSLFQAVIAGCP